MVAEGYLRPADTGTLLTLRVSPGARTTAIEGPYGESALKLRVSAPPVDGKANEEITRFPSRLLRVSRSDVEVVRGASGRDRTVLLRGVDPAEARSALVRTTP